MLNRAALMLVSLALAACSVAAATPGSPFLPLPSATPGPAVVTPPSTPILLATETPSPTPVTYVVQKGDTLVAIAVKYGVSVEALQAANNNVQPEFLAIGAVLLIPPPEGGPPVVASGLPTATAVPVEVGPPACWPVVSGALYCFAAARNAQGFPLMNVAARIVLADQAGLPLASGTAYSALDVIPPGGVAPLAALFPAAPAGWAAAVAQVVSAQPAGSSTVTVLEIVSQSGAQAGGQWTMSGQVRNPGAAPLPNVVLTLTLFDARGRVLGYRQASLPGGVGAGETSGYSISASPLGGTVFNLNIVAQGRP